MKIVIAAVIICWVVVSVTQSVMLHEAREKLLQYEIKQREAELELNHVKLLLEKSLNQKEDKQ